jgi:exonuclease SbcC
MAIARLLANQDILILDEPTSMLDAQRRKDLVMVFERTRPTKQTLVVTHDSEFERVADAVFHIAKKGGRSQVITESITQAIKDVATFKALTQERFQSLEI